MEWRFWNSFAIPIYILGIILLIAVLIFGNEVKGSKSWFNIAGFSFQPVEFVKMSTAIALAAFFSFFKRELGHRTVILQAMGIILLPVLLVLLQPDVGSALVFMSFFLLFYRLGMHPAIYLSGAILLASFVLTIIYEPEMVSLGAISLSIILFAIVFMNKRWHILAFAIPVLASWIYYDLLNYYFLIPISALVLLASSVIYYLRKSEKQVFLLPIAAALIVIVSFSTDYFFDEVLKPHQQDRINVWLNPEKSDPRGNLYNVLQSKTAIGSGGIAGKGFLNGTMTHLNFVPEQSTDFIFSALAEEHGFAGVFLLVLLYTVLIYRIIMIGENGKTVFITYFAYSVAGFYLLHFVMNIGMNLGILPVVGIPLPLLSKGGSSILIFSIMMGILLKMDSERNIR
jgi:rod shape determining protein RodA